jgi:hypothetical protein
MEGLIRIVSRTMLISSVAGIIAGSVISLLAPSASAWFLLGSCLAALSGAIFGAVFGVFAGKWVGHDILAVLQKILDAHANTFVLHPENALLSSPERLHLFRIPLHHYHLTVIDGNPTWRYRIFDFRSCPEGGYDHRIQFEVADPRTGLIHRYELALGIRDARVILVQRRLSGEEPSVIELFPNGSQGFRNCAAGIAQLQNWDGTHMVTKCLISRSPLVAGIEEGTVTDAGHIQFLNDTWASEYRSVTMMISEP